MPAARRRTGRCRRTAQWKRGPPSAVRRGNDRGRPQAPVRAVPGGRAKPPRLPADQPLHLLPRPGDSRRSARRPALAAAARGHLVVRDRVADQLRAEPRAELPVARRGRRPAAALHRGEREQLPDLRARAHRPPGGRRRLLRARPRHRRAVRGRLPVLHDALGRLQGHPQSGRRRSRRGPGRRQRRRHRRHGYGTYGGNTGTPAQLSWAIVTSSASASDGNVLIRGGYVLTMDSGGDIPGGDVHVRDGEIVAVGTDLDAPGADVIDAVGKIVAPGLIDTHWHMWNTLLRGLSDGRPDGESPARSGYFVTCVTLGRHFLPGDTYAGTRLACAEAIDAGITTVHDWAHNIRGIDWAEAGLRALSESGLRARFSFGYETGHQNDRLMALDDLASIASAWPRAPYSAGGRIH